MEKTNVMQYESVLPVDFDGTFRFTNWTDEDFIGRWNSKDYRFPAKTTSPIVMTNQTPLEIQQIRKKFAKDLAEREFGKGEEYKRLLRQERNDDGSARLPGIHGAGTYSLDNLAVYIQKCLEPLPVGRVAVTEAPKIDMENRLSRNETGELNSTVVDRKTSLKKKALEA